MAVAPSERTRRADTSGRRRPTLEDEQASELLVAFARLARGARDAPAMPKQVEALLQRGYLAPRHLGVFAVIALAGPLTVSELAAREGLAVSTTSLLVTQLAEVGLVERREDNLDRRRTLVSIAPAYRRESRAVLESRLAPLRRGVRPLGAGRAAPFVEGLQNRAPVWGRAQNHTPPSRE